MSRPPAWRHDPIISTVAVRSDPGCAPRWTEEPAVCGYRRLHHDRGDGPVAVPICATPVAVSGVGVLVAAYDGTLTLYGRDLAKQYWQRRLDGPVYSSPVVDHERRRVVVATTTGTVTSVDLKGRVAWTAAVGGPVLATAAVLASADLLVLGVFGSMCVALDLATGAERFRRRLPPPWAARLGGSAAVRDPYASPVATERGTVVVACAEHVVSLEPDGSTRWEVEIGHAVRASPVALGDRDEVAVVAVGGRCCFLSADTGALLGQVDLGGKVTASPALSGGTLAVGTRGGDAFGIDVATRQVRWTTPHQAPRDHTSFTVLPDGAFLAANQRGDLVALEVEDGRFRWETTQLLGLSEHDPAIDITPVAEPDGSMYSGSYSGVLYHHRFRPQADPLAAPVETTAAPALARRVSGLVGRVAGDGPGSSTADGWPSLAVDHLDLAHLAVHLEGNERHLAMVALHAEAIAAVTDPGGCRRAADGLRTADPTASPSPLEPWVAELDRRATGADTDRQVEVERSCAEVRAALAAVEAGRRALVERVRGRKTAAPPGAVIGAALAAMDDDTQRRKVIDAWHRMGGRQEPVLADAIDRAVAARRRHAEHSGHLSVADQTFERCRVGVVEVEEFLEDNLARALGRRRDLARSLAETTGATDAPLLHLARAAAAVRGAGPAPRLPLAGCLAAAATVAERVFGMEVRVPDVDGASSLVLPVRTGTDRVGSIRVDLVPAPDRLGDDVEDRHPGRTAHLLAVVDAGDDGPALSFDSARSLFHEVGHALDHLLLTTPWAPRTGLDAGPLERFEEMSTWWELLVFHPDLGRVVGLDADQEDGLARARRLRALETASLDLARAWVALLDLRLHRSATADVATVQADLARCGDDGAVDPLGLPDLAGYLAAMVMREHPGAGHLYPWAAARAAAAAGDLLGTPWEALAPTPATDALLRGRIEPDLPSWPPDAAALDALPDGVGL